MSRYDKYTWDTNSIYNPTRMNHIEQGIYDADLREGGTIKGNFIVDSNNATSTTTDARFLLGNNIPNGTTGSTRGVLTIYDKNQYRASIIAGNGYLTTDRLLTIPDKTGNLVVGQVAHFNCTGVASTYHSQSGWYYADYEITLNKTYGSNAVVIVGHQRGVPFVDQADITGNKLYIRIWSLSSFDSATSFAINVFLSENESITT